MMTNTSTRQDRTTVTDGREEASERARTTFRQSVQDKAARTHQSGETGASTDFSEKEKNTPNERRRAARESVVQPARV